MRFKTTIILAVVLLLLSAYLYFIEIPGKRKAEQENKVFNLDWEKVSKLRIRLDDYVTVCRKNNKGEWEITEPMKAEANQPSVEVVIDSMKNLEINRVVESSPKDLSFYGQRSGVKAFCLSIAPKIVVPTHPVFVEPQLDCTICFCMLCQCIGHCLINNSACRVQIPRCYKGVCPVKQVLPCHAEGIAPWKVETGCNQCDHTPHFHDSDSRRSAPCSIRNSVR